MTDDGGTAGLSLKEWVARLDGKLDAFAAQKADRSDVDRVQVQLNEVEHHIKKLDTHFQAQLTAAVLRGKLWKAIGGTSAAASSIALVVYYITNIHR